MKNIIISICLILLTLFSYGQLIRKGDRLILISSGGGGNGKIIWGKTLDSFIQDTTCVKDTAEAYLQIQACDSCKVRLRIGYVVVDKCSPIGNPEIVEYINVTFLDIKRIPLPERATVIKYTRKN